MRRVTLSVLVAMTGSVSAGAADLSTEWTCVDEAVARSFLETQYLDVVIYQETKDIRTYRGTKDGARFSIEMDACTSEILSEAKL
jgi:hypothetical protein